MITTINNDHRVFIVEIMGWFTRQYFCNMEEIQKVIADMEPNDEYRIFEFWNAKIKRFSRKKLIEMLKANHMDYSFVK